MRHALTLLALLPALALAQNPTIDSLTRLLRTQPPDTSRVNTLHHLATSYIETDQHPLAWQTATEGLRLARRIGWQLGETWARIQLARIAFDLPARAAEARRHLDTAQRTAETLYRRQNVPDLLIATLEQRGLLAQTDGNVPGSRSLFEQAQRLAHQTQRTQQEARLYNRLAELELAAGNYAADVDYRLKSLSLRQFPRDWNGIRISRYHIANAYINLNLLTEAIRALTELDSLARVMRDTYTPVRTNVLWADVLEKQGHYAEALPRRLTYLRHCETAEAASRWEAYAYLSHTYLKLGDARKALTTNQKAEAEARAINNGQLVSAHQQWLWLNYADTYLTLGQPQRTVAYATEGLALADRQRTQFYREGFLKLLADAHERLKQPALALQFQKRYKAVADSALNAEAVQKATALVVADRATRDRQADQLRQQADLQLLEAEKQTLVRNLLIALLLMGLAGLGYVVWANRQLLAKAAELARKNTDIETALVRGQTLERKRVASELHDSVAARVSALRWRFEAFDDGDLTPAQQTEHARLLDALGEVYDDVRAISHNLMPETLEKQGLRAALERLTDTLNVQQRTRFALTIADSVGTLPTATAYELYAITLELVNNILKHARARQATIQLTQAADHLQLIIADDGTGLPVGVQETASGIGFQNLKARVERLRGQYSVSNGSSGGLQVRVDVPVR
jgi:signal transduction histidine kinase